MSVNLCLFPNTRNGVIAFGAPSVQKGILEDGIAVAFDEQGVTGGTIGILKIPDLAGKISDIDKVESRFLADLGGPKKRFHGRILRVRHLVIFMECGDMPGDIG